MDESKKREPKRYLVCMHCRGECNYKEGTVKELTAIYQYTLECGQSWEREKGNKKISLRPRTIQSLILNVNNAIRNKMANGCSSQWIELVKEL